MTTTFHPAGLADISTLLGLIREFYAYDRHAYDEAALLPALRLLLKRPDYGRVWLVRAGEEIAGYLVVTYGFALESGGRDLLIDELYLREAFRAQGLGRQIIVFVKDFCRAEGIGSLWLEVEAHNTAALAFYERVGFVGQDSAYMQMDVG